VDGEEWSAVCVNGRAAAGTAVQVLRVTGVRLEVWAEHAELSPADDLDRRPKPELFRLADPDCAGHGPEAGESEHTVEQQAELGSEEHTS